MQRCKLIPKGWQCPRCKWRIEMEDFSLTQYQAFIKLHIRECWHQRSSRKPKIMRTAHPKKK